MTWLEANLSLQIIAELGKGAPERMAVKMLADQQQAASDRLREAVG
jgi:hypothetical protein